MSVYRSPKRKTASHPEAVPPRKAPKKKRPKSSTADNLESLINLLDDEATAHAGLVPDRKTGKSAADRASRTPREEPPSAAGALSFMQELARARADLHKEHCLRIASQQEVESLRLELARLAANESAELAALRREHESLQKQLAALDKQRRKLQSVRFDLESQLEKEQTQREQLNDQLDAINERLATECSRRQAIAAELEATQRESTRRTSEADAATSAWEAARVQLRTELASLTSRCEHAVQARDASQAASLQWQTEAAALTERIANAETKLHERDELIQQTRNAADELARSASVWEERFQREQAERAQVERQLRAELTDVRQEKENTAITLAEAAATNETLERRMHELDLELAASIQCAAERPNDSEVVNERIARLESDIAKARVDLAETYERLGAARLRLANADRDREHAQQREAEALRRANELSDEVASLQASVQREAASKRKAEAVHKRDAGTDEASALFEAEQRIERLSRELTASKGVEAAYQQKAARKVQQVKQELETLQRRLDELEQRPETN